MMLSDFFALVHSLLRLPVGVLAVGVFLFSAVAVVSYRVVQHIDGPLTRAGIMTFSFLVLTSNLEQGSELLVSGFWLAVFIGIARSTYERLH